MANLQPQELEHLVSAAVQKALQQRKITDAELKQILHGPITIGLIADPHHLPPDVQKAPGEAARPGVFDKHRLIGFIAPNLEKLEATIKAK